MRIRKHKFGLLLAWLAVVVLSTVAFWEFLRTDSTKKQDSIEDKKTAWAEFLVSHPYYNRSIKTEAEWKRIPRQDRPDLAMEQDYLMTMDPALGRVPRERLMRANKQVERLFQGRAPISGISWQERGPNNVGGRTRALMFDPNDVNHKKVWAGGVSGGLWFTTDITATPVTWTHVDDFWDNITVSSIAYNPANTQEFYVGTGEGWFNVDAQQGGGIWKSSDGGSSWSGLASTEPGATYPSSSDFVYVNKIVIKSDGTIFAATRGYYINRGGIMRSTDGGTSWTEVLAPYPTTYDRVADIEIAANGDLYASLGYGGSIGKVYKSLHADNGAFGTWTDLSSAVYSTSMFFPKRIELACAPSDANTIYAVAQGGSGDNDVEWFKKSINGGTTWSDLPIPRLVSDGTTHFTRSQAFYDLILAVHPTDPNYVIAGGIDLHRSTNGGASWSGISHWYGGFGQPEVHADQHAIQFRPGASDEVIFGNDGGVYYSTNAGDDMATPTFVSRNTNYNVTQFYACAAKNEVNSQYFLAGAQDNGSQQFDYPQIGSTTEVTGGDGAYCHIDQLNPDIQTTQYTYNSIYRSLNGGISFPSLISDPSGLFINPSEYDSQRKILYSTAADDNLKRISGMDGAITNADLSISVGGAKVSTLKMSPYNDVLFLGITNGRIYKFTDASTGSPVLTRIDDGTTPITTAGWPSSIDVGANDNHILVTYSNFGVESIWETTDGGANWYSKEGNLPDIPVRWALYNPDNRDEVLLATELGVWSTDNFGTGTTNAPDWGPSNANLAHTRATMLKYRPADKLVAVSTHGRGLFTTDIFVATSVADFTFSQNSTINCTGSLTVDFTDGSLKPEGSWAWDVDNDGITDYTTQNPSHTYSSPGLYTVRLTVNGGAAEVVKNVFLVMNSEPTLNTGCTLSSNSNLGNGFGIGIFRFALGDIDYTSPHNDGYYNNYVCTQWTTLELGASYDVTIRTGTANNEGARVYIDYNDNGVFEAGESVVSFPANKDGTRTLSFVTPTSSVTLGKGLRLRVLSRFSNTPIDACNIGDYGQTEDYTVYFADDKYLDISGLRLQGAMPTSGTTMRTDINSLIPTTDPYGVGVSTSSIPASAVDWVKVELRSGAGPGSATTVVASTAGFLFDDGAVKAVNGSKVNFVSVPDGNYYVAIQHRNHLGVITDAAIALAAGSLSLDMSSVTIWTDPAVTTNTPTTTVNGVRALWGGDANGNGKVTYNGGTNDRESVLAQLSFNILNEDLTYQSEDVNLNAKTSYNGGTNDRESILQILGFSITGERVAHLP